MSRKLSLILGIIFFFNFLNTTPAYPESNSNKESNQDEIEQFIKKGFHWLKENKEALRPLFKDPEGLEVFEASYGLLFFILAYSQQNSIHKNFLKIFFQFSTSDYKNFQITERFKWTPESVKAKFYSASIEKIPMSSITVINNVKSNGRSGNRIIKRLNKGFGLGRYSAVRLVSGVVVTGTLAAEGGILIADSFLTYLHRKRKKKEIPKLGDLSPDEFNQLDQVTQLEVIKENHNGILNTTSVEFYNYLERNPDILSDYEEIIENNPFLESF